MRGHLLLECSELLPFRPQYHSTFGTCLGTARSCSQDHFSSFGDRLAPIANRENSMSIREIGLLVVSVGRLLTMGMWEVYSKKMDTGHVPTDAELDDLVAYVGAL
jgi:hypothetical protein